jgi:hypothetical protein
MYHANAYSVHARNPEGKRPLENPGVNGILKRTLK